MHADNLKHIEFVFPTKGYISGHTSFEDRQTSDCLNVRNHNRVGARGVGGTRPALVPAHDGQIASGQAVQWMGWLDCGYGDSVMHADSFSYSDGPLSTRSQTRWPGAQSGIEVVGSRATVSVLDSPRSAGSFAVGGDTWEDFAFDAIIEWNYATTGEVRMWIGTGSSGSNGALLVFNVVSTPVVFPGLGYTTKISATMTVAGRSQTWSVTYGPLMMTSVLHLTAIADQNSVHLLWNSHEVLSLPRSSSTHCTTAGFSMSKSNPNPDDLPDGYVDIRLARFSLLAASAAGVIHRRLVAVAGGSVYATSQGGSMSSEPVDSDNVGSSSIISAARCNGKLFIVNGSDGWCYDPQAPTDNVKAWTPRRGAMPGHCRLVANWRNRMVMAGSKDDPQNYFLSRQDDPWDFDYGQDDSKTAIRGDLATAGKIDDPITALCPISNDMLIIGCGRSLWMMRGDPAQGGLAHQICTQTGIIHPNAWTTDPQGNLYFLGEHGLYSMTQAGIVQNISVNRVAQLSEGICLAGPGRWASLAFDPSRWGVLVFITSPEGIAGSHWFYDIHNEAFFPERYPSLIGPTCCAYYAAEDCQHRGLLLGGLDGRIYTYDDDATCDLVGSEAVPIPTRATLATSEQFDRRTTIIGLGAELDPNFGSADYELRGDFTRELTQNSPPQITGTFLPGFNHPRLKRAAGHVHLLTLSTNDARRWSMNKVFASVVD